MDDDFSSEPDTVATAYVPLAVEAAHHRAELVAAGLVEERAEVVA